MAPINFEDNIREKLDEREIQPSTSAWNKLNTQLDASDEKRSSYGIWYAVAASFIGILILASVFYSRTKNASDNNTDFVEMNASEKEEVKEIPTSNQPISVSEGFDESSIVSEDLKVKDQSIETKTHKKDALPSKLLVEKSQPNQDVAKIDILKEKQQENLKLPNPKVTMDDEILNSKVAKVVAQVEQIGKNNGTITSEEIESLLANAQREIQNQRILSSKKVDPAALLGDIELELERSFRDRVFNALGDGFEYIRTAVVERNN